MKHSHKLFSAFVLACGLVASTALSQPFPGATWTLTETGTATLTYQGNTMATVPGVLQLEPLSGIVGLYYNLNIPNQAGDVLLLEPVTFETNDVLRFDGRGVYFFSDLEPNDPNPDLADVPQIPLVVQGNSVTILEIGPEGNNGALWIPPSGFAGEDLSGAFPGIQYNIISDVPEPGSAAMAGLIALLSLFKWRRGRSLVRGNS